MIPFRRDLFVGTAEYYERFRLPYADVLVDDLRARVPLTSGSRVLDLACGTGQIAFALAGDVGEVWAVDQEPEMIDVGRRKARELGVDNIRWTVASAERVVLDRAFDLVAIGNAFHRVERDVVAGRLAPHLASHGCIALLWSEPSWIGEQPWQRALDDTVEHWRDAVGARDRVPVGWEAAIDRDPHAEVLRRVGLRNEQPFECTVSHRWTVESLTGFMYSTSFLNRVALGERTDEFGRDLRAALLAAQPDGIFDQDVSYGYELARRPD